MAETQANCHARLSVGSVRALRLSKCIVEAPFERADPTEGLVCGFEATQGPHGLTDLE